MHQALSEGFGAVRRALERVQSNPQPSTVVVNAAIGFTSLYLIPRLAQFQARFREHRVQIVTRDQNRGYDINEADVIITFGDQGLKGLQSRPVFQEQLIPLCAPGFLANDEPVPLSALSDLPLLHMSSADHADDWLRYFEGTGFRFPAPAETDRIMSYMVYLYSIQNGQGVGLGWGQLVEQMIKDRRLVKAAERVVETSRAYHANLTPQASNNPSANAFFEWLPQTRFS